MESAILFGNGFNRIAGNGMSWEELLMDLAKVHQLPSKSNTLNYECIYVNICNGGWKFGKESVVQTEYGLKCQIADSCRDFRSGPIYEELALMPVGVYLTTNYEGVLDRTLVKMGYEYDRNSSCTTESIYSIRRCHAYQKPFGGMDKRIFPIHGEQAAPKSIMIGYDHYCGSLVS